MPLNGKLRREWNTHEWRDQAMCRGYDPDLFFPAGETGPALAHAEAAKAVCLGCPVRAECLEFAMVSNQEAGVWGGFTEEERRKLRRSWRTYLYGSRLAATGRQLASP
jgi:WhiB family redox-sensing transcriptional regulator